MINLISLVFAFFKNNRLKIVGCLAAIAIVFGAYKFGQYQGETSTELKYANARVQQANDTLNQFIDSTKALTKKANEASAELAQQIVKRKLYDEQSTQALQNALNATANSRINCVFDDAVLQYIDDARANAVKATTGGVTR